MPSFSMRVSETEARDMCCECMRALDAVAYDLRSVLITALVHKFLASPEEFASMLV